MSANADRIEEIIVTLETAANLARLGREWDKVYPYMVLHPQDFFAILPDRKWPIAFQIVFHGNLDLLKRILGLFMDDQVNIRFKGKDGKTILDVAKEVQVKHPTILTYIEHLYAQDELITAAKDSKWQIVLDLLANNEQLANEKPPYSPYFLLHYVVQDGDTHILQDLLRRFQFQTNVLSNNNETPLAMATRLKKSDMISVLRPKTLPGPPIQQIHPRLPLPTPPPQPHSSPRPDDRSTFQYPYRSPQEPVPHQIRPPTPPPLPQTCAPTFSPTSLGFNDIERAVDRNGTLSDGSSTHINSTRAHPSQSQFQQQTVRDQPQFQQQTVRDQPQSQQQTVRDQPQFQQQTVRDQTQSQQQTVRDQPPHQQQTVRNQPQSQQQTVRDQPQFQQQTVRDQPQSQQQTVRDQPPHQQQTVRNQPQSQQQTVRDQPQFQQQTVRDQTQSQQQTVRDQPPHQQQTVRDQPQSQQQTVRDQPQSQQQTVRDQPPHQQQTVRDQPQSQQQTVRDQPQSQQQTVRDQPPHQQQTVRDQPQFQQQTVRDQPPHQQQTVRDQPQSQQQTVRDQPQSQQQTVRDQPPHQQQTVRDQPPHQQQTVRDHPQFQQHAQNPRAPHVRTNKTIISESPLPPSRPPPLSSIPAVEVTRDTKCFLSMETFVDPVIAEDGETYERKDITDWVKLYHCSPKTSDPMDLTFWDDIEMKQIIQSMQRQN